MKLTIIGCGLAGLACGIQAKKSGLDVLVLEKSSVLAEVGAGIQIPPNGTRILKHLGLLDAVLKHAVILDSIDLRRYEDGDLLWHGEFKRMPVGKYGTPWCVTHRADYHQVLLDAARELGIEIRLGAEIQYIDFGGTKVVLEDGSVFGADAIVGADGIWSQTRDQLLGHPSPPTELGDLAYRAVLATETLTALGDAKVNEFLSHNVFTSWIGPGKSCVVYPVRAGHEWNMVLVRPNDLRPDMEATPGDIVGEIRETFKGWDELLTTLISCIPASLKWQMLIHEEIKTWCKGNAVLIGDASHPTLPYHAQGGAMAVEDGVLLGHLLGRLLHDFSSDHIPQKVPEALRFFEVTRKERTTWIVNGARTTHRMYTIHDGPEQAERDMELKSHDGTATSRWPWLDADYQNNLLGFDVIADLDHRYEKWATEQDDGSGRQVPRCLVT